MGRKAIHLTGTINGFKLLSFKKPSYYLVLCPHCKNKKVMRIDGIRNSKSCGCLNRGNTHYNYKHGQSKGNLIYFMWHDMKNRCYNKNSDRYNCYGARGIEVCEDWKNNYKSFYNFAINNGWNKKLQIDRIDNDGNYEPKNCRFVTSIVNSRKRQNTVWVDLNGEKFCLAEACEILNLNQKAYYSIYHMLKRGRSFKKSVNKYKNKNPEQSKNYQ